MTASLAGSKIQVAVVGGSGYAGFETIRWLLRHPHVEISGLYGPPDELGPIDGFFPLLSKQLPMRQELFDIAKISRSAELVLLCVPHKVAMGYVPKLREAGLKVIDFSADYRLKDPAVYEKWYCPHTDVGRLAEAVYGLPEFYRDAIANAQLIANPGCYPTCSVLALGPLLKEGLIAADGIIVNAISGVSGAGRRPNQKYHFPDRNENFEPYAVGTHRHAPEIRQVLSAIAAKEVSLTFVPHLCPMDRGMLCSIYAQSVKESVTSEKLTDVLNDYYGNAAFVRVRTEVLPAVKYVVHTNFCDVAARMVNGRVIIFSALDNLVKGASGQAIQNMNIMYGWDETTGLI
ncbi:MAG: N-acetyl-gamma-glutamyl-phosphate reductase [Planctomycetes bacterium]|nr:N-acetyl-gamma-glutamyl-phosphate reductase [Planctomycetota bacterium]